MCRGRKGANNNCFLKTGEKLEKISPILYLNSYTIYFNANTTKTFVITSTNEYKYHQIGFFLGATDQGIFGWVVGEWVPVI